MFFIYHDQAKLLEGQEQRRPRADHHLSRAFADHFPDATAFGHGDAGMPFSGLCAKAFLNAGQEFGGQGNFGQQHQRLAPLAQTFCDGLKIDLGFA